MIENDIMKFVRLKLRNCSHEEILYYSGSNVLKNISKRNYSIKTHVSVIALNLPLEEITFYGFV